jgi:hypothetical protein
MGVWVENQISYLRPNRLHCDLCGQPIAGLYWKTVTESVGELSFCERAHEQKYFEYWLPRYGPAAGGS